MSRLGQLLVRERKLNESDRKTIRRESGSFRGSYARSVLALGVMNEVELAKFFAKKTSFKMISGNLVSEIDSDVLTLIPSSMLRWFDVLPLRRSHGVLQVAMVDPTDKEVLSQLEFFSGHKIKPIIATLSDIRASLADVLENSSEFSNSEFEGFLGKFVPRTGQAGAVKSRRPERQKRSDETEDHSDWVESDVVEEQSTMTDDSGGEVMDDEFKSEPVEAVESQGIELHESEEQPAVAAAAPAEENVASPPDAGVSVDDMLSDIQSPPGEKPAVEASAASGGIDLNEWEAAINGPDVVEASPVEVAAESAPEVTAAPETATEDPSIEAQTADADPKLFDDLNAGSESLELAAPESLELAEPESIESIEEPVESVTQELVEEVSSPVEAVSEPVPEISEPVAEQPAPVEAKTQDIVSKVSPAVAALNRSLVKLALISELGPACQTVAETAWKNGMKSGAICFVGEVGVVEGVLWKTSEGKFTSEASVPKNFELQDALSLVQTSEGEKIWHLLSEAMSDRETVITESWHSSAPNPNFGCAIPIAKGFIVSFIHCDETQDSALRDGFVEVLRALSFKL